MGVYWQKLSYDLSVDYLFYVNFRIYKIYIKSYQQ